MDRSYYLFIFLLTITIVACTPEATPTPTVTATPVLTAIITPTNTHTPEPTSTSTPTPTRTPVPPTPTPTPTPLVQITVPEGTPQEQADYLLSLLKEHGYEALVTELKKLPEFQTLDNGTIEALADIVNLAVNATDSETKEAFQLMLRGGTPRQSDFHYRVPTWNVQLQILFEMARQVEFNVEDRLALANAAVNGILIAMGNDEVDRQVYMDAVDVLNFFRKPPLQDRIHGYPYAALLALCWRGGGWDGSPDRGPDALGLYDYKQKPLDLDGYEWNFISPDTLQSLWDNPVPIGTERMKKINVAVDELEQFYKIGGPHWVFGSYDETITIDGRQVRSRNYNNPNAAVAIVMARGKGLGSCGDQFLLFETALKAQGIATLKFGRKWLEPDGSFKDGHANVIYFDPASDLWRIHEIEFNMGTTLRQQVTIYKPPVVVPGWPKWIDPYPFGVGHWIIYSADISKEEVQSIFSQGIPTSVIEDGMYK